MDELLRLITLQDYNTRVVLLGAAALGAAAGAVGAFAVLRRRALAGDALAHASLPGVCVAFLALGERSLPVLLVGALVFASLGAATLALLRRFTRLKEDAALGVVLAGYFGLGVALLRHIQNSPNGQQAGLETFVFGHAATMVRKDAMLIAIVALAAMGVVALLYKELKLLCFDREFSASLGRPVLVLDLILLALIAIVTVVGLPAAGVVLMAALLIIPAAAARFWTQRLGIMLLLSGVLGVIAGVAGVAASALVPDLSTGPSITLAAAALFVLSMFFAPQRGMLVAGLRRRRLAQRIGVQNLLRDLFELDESRARGGQAEPSLWPIAEIALKRARESDELERSARRALSRGYVTRDGDHLRLSPSGQQEAHRLVRAHRLWELYLIEQARIAPDHVDRDADEIEHLLSEEDLDRLDRRLAELGRVAPGLPLSPHQLRAPSGGAS
jgi:manganese/zinc/iron transport system permease protein